MPSLSRVVPLIRAQIEAMPVGTTFWAGWDTTLDLMLARKTSELFVSFAWQSHTDGALARIDWSRAAQSNWPEDVASNLTLRLAVLDAAELVQVDMLLVHSPAALRRWCWERWASQSHRPIPAWVRQET